MTVLADMRQQPVEASPQARWMEMDGKGRDVSLEAS